MADVKAFFNKLFSPVYKAKKATGRKLSPISDKWYAESFALAIAAASLSSAGILLYYYDKKPITEWNNKLTLNATISVLATLARTMMLVSTATCLSQYGWIWFKGEMYPLADFELITQASRGPGGSLKMLLRSVPLMFRNHRSVALLFS